MSRLWQLQDIVIIPSNVAMTSKRDWHVHVFHENLCSPLTYFPKPGEEMETEAHRSRYLRGVCSSPSFPNGPLSSWLCIAWSPSNNTNWCTVEKRFVCFVFIFASPLMTTEGITKLMPYACEIPFDSFYCNGRWQQLSEQKKHAWEKVNIEHLLGNKAPFLTFAAASLSRAWWPESDDDNLTRTSSCLRKWAFSLSLGFAEF